MTFPLLALLGLVLYVALFFVLPKLLLLLAPFIIVLISWTLWRWSRAASVLMAFFLGGLPAVWIYSSISQFKAACASVPKAQIASRPPSQDGFLLDAWAIRTLRAQKFISPLTFVDKGAFSYVEQYLQSPEYIRAHNLEARYTRRYADRVETVAEPLSKYTFATSILDRGSYGAPLYEVQHSIRRVSDGSVIATATDIVFGGGIIGSYLVLLGDYAVEDQDAVLISCGYADADIGAWRPNNVSEPRWSKYRDADRRFAESALKGRT